MTIVRRVTIKDVAAAAGLSIATVSNVVNHPQIVKPETLGRVRDCIERLGFVPDSAARQLRLGVTSAVGAVMRDLENPYSSQVIAGMDDCLRESMWMLMVTSSRDGAARQGACVDFFERQRVAGVVVRACSEDYSVLEAAGARGVNIVLLDTSVPSATLSSVDIDHAGGANLALSYLLSAGSRRILYLEDDVTCAAVPQVNAGITDALKNSGLSSEETITKVSYDSATFDAAYATVSELLGSGAAFDAIFAGNEVMALAASQAVNTSGLARKECLIVGYGDGALGKQHDTLPISSVRLPMFELGKRAAELAMHASDEPIHESLLPELLEFRSTK